MQTNPSVSERVPYKCLLEYSSLLKHLSIQRAIVQNSGQDVLSMDFKGWQSKRKVNVTHLGTNNDLYKRSYEFMQDESLKNLFHVTSQGVQLDVLEIINNMKAILKHSYCTEPFTTFALDIARGLGKNGIAKKPSEILLKTQNTPILSPMGTSFLTSQSSHSLIKSDNILPPHICFSGNLNTGKSMFIMKQSITREQKLVGDCEQVLLEKKSAMKQQYSVNINTDDYGYNDLIVLSCIVCYVYFAEE